MNRLTEDELSQGYQQAMPKNKRTIRLGYTVGPWTFQPKRHADFGPTIEISTPHNAIYAFNLQQAETLGECLLKVVRQARLADEEERGES